MNKFTSFDSRIFKYALEAPKTTLQMPRGAIILTVQVQVHNKQICIWANCDPTARLEPRTFSIFGTGQPMAFHGASYIGTVQELDGRLVWHVFETPEKD